MEPLRAAAERGRAAFAAAFDAAVSAKPSLGPVASVLLYRLRSDLAERRSRGGGAVGRRAAVRAHEPERRRPGGVPRRAGGG